MLPPFSVRLLRRCAALALCASAAVWVSCGGSPGGPDGAARPITLLASGSVPLVPPSSTFGRGALAHESRPILGPGQRRFSIQVPANGALRVTYGVPRASWTPPVTGIEVRVTARQGTRESVLLRRVVERPANLRREAWTTAVVPLEAFAGETVDVALASRPLGDAAAPVEVLWGVPRLFDAGASRGRGIGERLNVVLISIDTLRPDHLGCYGYGRDTSPTIDRLAGAGVRFDQAFSTSGWTLPAHASMFTGLLPDRHGASRFGHETPLTRDHRTVAERFREAGYETAAFTGGVFVSLDLGLDQGFTLFADPGFLPSQQPRFADVAASAQRWLEGPGAGPFFLFLHTYEVHMPYDPPPPFDRAFDGAADGPFADGITTAQTVALGRSREQVPRRDLRQLRALYDGGIRHMDAALGDFLAFLDARGLRDNTCVVVTSDHGEEFQEHGNLFHHHGKLYDEIVRVPLILHCPSRLPAGVAVDAPVSLVDILPTLLDLAGLPALAGLDGRSVLPAVAGPGWPQRPIVSETDGSAAGRLGATRTVRRGELKLITSTMSGTPREQLFDLAADPGEQIDLHAARPDAVAALDAELAAALVRQTVSRPQPRAADAATRERMRALGYVE